MWHLSKKAAILALYACAACVRAAPEAKLPISARTDEVDSGWTTVVYNGDAPVLVGNDGGSGSGGLRAFELDGQNPIPEFKHEKPGRTKLVTTVYGVGGRDLVVTIAQTRLHSNATAGNAITHTQCREYFGTILYGRQF